LNDSHVRQFADCEALVSELVTSGECLVRSDAERDAVKRYFATGGNGTSSSMGDFCAYSSMELTTKKCSHRAAVEGVCCAHRASATVLRRQPSQHRKRLPESTHAEQDLCVDRSFGPEAGEFTSDRRTLTNKMIFNVVWFLFCDAIHEITMYCNDGAPFFFPGEPLANVRDRREIFVVSIVGVACLLCFVSKWLQFCFKMVSWYIVVVEYFVARNHTLQVDSLTATTQCTGCEVFTYRRHFCGTLLYKGLSFRF
jgi:hypothetical protein